jgi:hypothetical protein
LPLMQICYISQDNNSYGMANLDSLFKYDGTFRGVTVVNSRAYGDHIRKARTKFTLNKEMKESAAVLGQANVYAKAVKDAIDPYRRDFRDGMLWQRLVSLFKKQLAEKGSADFSALKGHELNKAHPLGRLFSTQTTASQSEHMLNIHVTSRYSKDPTGGKADGYQQTLIVLFVDDALKVQTFSESVYLSMKVDPGEQQLNCVIPEGTKTAIVILKCNFSSNNKTLDMQKGMGMRVEGVVGVGMVTTGTPNFKL